MSDEYKQKYTDPLIYHDKQLIIPPLGFHNTGAICYFNSLIQCLLSSKNFLSYIIDHENEHNIFKNFLSLIVQEDKWDPFFTTRLLHQCNMTSPNQSSSEYFIRLIDLLKIEPIFECHHVITMICQHCNKESEKKDTSYNPLINETFNEFFEFDEFIHGFNCDGCNQKTTLRQYKKLSGLSPILVLSLNKYFGKKMIEYHPSFTVGGASYRLIGTVEHTGSLNGGHYISRFNRNEKTYLADDSRLMEIQDNIIKPVIETYMIFYERFE